MTSIIQLDPNAIEEMSPSFEFKGGRDNISPYSMPEAIEVETHTNWAALKFKYPSAEGGDNRIRLLPRSGAGFPEAIIHLETTATLGDFTRKILAIELVGDAPSEKEIKELADELNVTASNPEMPISQRFSYQMVAAVLVSWKRQIVLALRAMSPRKK